MRDRRRQWRETMWKQGVENLSSGVLVYRPSDGNRGAVLEAIFKYDSVQTIMAVTVFSICSAVRRIRGSRRVVTEGGRSIRRT